MINSGRQCSKNLGFLWLLLVITILLLPSFAFARTRIILPPRPLPVPNPMYDNSKGTFYDDFNNDSAIAISGNAEIDISQNNIRISDNNSASLLFRGQNGSTVYQAKIKDNYLYVEACAAGLLVYDLTDPSNPQSVGQYNTPGCAYDIDFYGNYALLADQYNSDVGVQPSIAHQGGLQIIDISDPTNPIFVSSINTTTGSYAEGVKVIGHYVYVASIGSANNGFLDIYDISNISSPQLVNSISKPYAFRWRAGIVDGNYLYTAADRPADNSGLHIFNISDPANPIEVGSYVGGLNAYAPVSKVGNYVYLPGRYNGVYIIDVSNVANPVLAATVDTAGRAQNVVVSGDYGYVADGSDGLIIFNVNTHVIIGSYDTPGEAFDVDLYSGYAYVVDQTSIQVINISDPVNPTLTKEVKSLLFGDCRGVAASGNYAYVAHSNGLTIYDPSNPYTPYVVGGVYLSSPAYGVAVSGNYAYVADGAGGLQIIDISDKTNPTTTGSMATTGTALKVAISNNYAYVADGAGGLQIIDVSDPASPTSTATVATAGYAYGADLYDHYVLLAEGAAGFRIIDITDPTNATTTATVDTPGTAQQVVVSGNYAYVADTTSFRVYDISTIDGPVLRGTIATTNTNSVAVVGDYIAASSDSYNNVISSHYLTINVSDPDNPTVVDDKYTTGGANQITVSADYVYAADGDSGLAVFSHGFTAGDSGQVNSSTITPSTFNLWDRIVINNTLNGQVITYQVLDSIGDLIPDSVLPGNSTGFSATDDFTTIDIHALPITIYSSIKIKANLSTNSNIQTPTVDSWKVYWIKARAGGDTASNADGYVYCDATSSVGDGFTCAWDFDASDGVDWNNPNSTSCRASADYRSKVDSTGTGTYNVSLRIQQGVFPASDSDTKVVTIKIAAQGGWNPEEVSPKYLNLSANHRILLADFPNQSIISAQVLNKNEEAVPDMTVIAWSLVCPNLDTPFKDFACGILSNNQSSTTNGAVSVIFTPGQLAGSIIVRGCATNGVCAEQTIKVALKQRGKIVLKSNYSTLPADGKSRIKIYIKAYDRYLNPWPNAVISLKLIGLDTDQKEIKSTGDLSSMEIKTDNNGEAFVYFSPGEQIGKIKIKADLKNSEPLSGFKIFDKLAYFLRRCISSLIKSTAGYFFNFVMAAQKIPITTPIIPPPGEEVVPPPTDEEVGGDINIDLIDPESMTAVVEDGSQLPTQPQVPPPTQPPDPIITTPTPETPGSQTGVSIESQSSSAPPPLPEYLRVPITAPATEVAPVIIESQQPETKSTEAIANNFPTPTEIINKTTDLIQNTINTTTATVKKVQEDQTVQTVNQVVAPTVSVVTVVAVAASGAASSATAVPLFNMVVLLFTQPSYLLTRRRKSWGTVYDSLSKEPVSLAIVRLYEIVLQADGQNKTRKLIQTRVTSADGRYFFLVKPYTNYQVEVICNGYKFPSHILKDGIQETVYTDVYYGEIFNSNDNTIINPNLPLDSQEGKVSLVGFNKKIKTIFADLEQFLKAPIDEKEKEYQRIKKESLIKKALRALAYLAPILGFINLLISPSRWTLSLLILQILMLLVFRYFIEKILPYKQRLGRVFDIDTNKNISQSLVYLFEPQFGKLIQTQIADNNGLYGFLIGNQKYYLVAEKPGYIFSEGKVEIEGIKDGLVKKDLGMKKA